jgi:hypothetical protein
MHKLYNLFLSRLVRASIEQVIERIFAPLGHGAITRESAIHIDGRWCSGVFIVNEFSNMKITFQPVPQPLRYS